MSRLLAVAARELRERWLLFPGALAAGFFPIVFPAFGESRALAPTVGIAGTVLFGVATAVVIGSSMLARDAANGRLGFLFSRPLPWSTIWGGKWLAAIALAATTSLLMAIPWTLAYPLSSLGGHHGDSWWRAFWESEGSVLFAVILLLAIGLANFNGTAFRSRSPWLAVDLVLLLLAIWTVRHTVVPLVLLGVVGIHPLSRWGLLAPMGILATAFLAASAVQVARGRTDLRRAHVAMSVAFWAIVFAALGLAAARLSWARAARPADVEVQVATSDATGRWVYAFGASRRGGSTGVLIDSSSGRFLSLGLVPGWWAAAETIAFSTERSLGAQLVASPDGGASAVRLLDLAAAPAPRAQTVVFESSPPPRSWRNSALALSPSGRLALLVHETGASLYEVPSGRRVATTTLPPGWRAVASCFLDEGRARVWLVAHFGPGVAAHLREAPALAQVVDLAVDGTGQRTPFALTRPADWRWPLVLPNARADRVLTDFGRLELRDGETGSLIATLEEGPGRRSAAFVSDGRIAVADAPSGRARLRVFDAGGVQLSDGSLDLAPGGSPLVGPEVAPGRVAVAAGNLFAGGQTLVVDLGTLAVVERLEGLLPAPSSTGLVLPAVRPPKSAHSFVGQGQLVRIDFSTGERKVVAGPGAPRGERISVR